MIPDKVKIGGLTYVIQYDPVLASARDRFAECNVMQQIISIDSNVAKDKQEESLCHEITEAINNACELELPHNAIRVIGFMWHQVLRDNNLRFGE